MKIFVLIVMTALMIGDSKDSLTFDFGKEGNTDDWFIVDDGVMGGLSQGNLELSAETMRFHGSVSLENNGGFSSYRSRFGQYDLSDYNKVTIRARGHGQKIGFQLKLTEPFYEPYFRVNFEPKDEWQEFVFPLDEFFVWRMSDAMQQGMPEKYRSEIIRMGLITASKKAGPFELEIDYIRFE